MEHSRVVVNPPSELANPTVRLAHLHSTAALSEGQSSPATMHGGSES